MSYIMKQVHFTRHKLKTATHDHKGSQKKGNKRIFKRSSSVYVLNKGVTVLQNHDSVQTSILSHDSVYISIYLCRGGVVNKKNQIYFITAINVGMSHDC